MSDFPRADSIRVPECAHLQPTLYPHRPYWGEHLRALNHHDWMYYRAFSQPDVPYRRARLHFEGVDYYAAVWLNDQRIGEHEGGFAPFMLDATAVLGEENRLVVQVSSPWDPPNPGGSYPVDHVKRGMVKGLYEHGEGVIPPDVNPLGIWRPVWLVLDEGISLDHMRVHTALDGAVTLRITVTNATGQPWQGTLALAVHAENHDGPGTSHTQSVSLSPGTQYLEVALQVPEPRLWWPWDHGDPHLYRLEAAFINRDGRPVYNHTTVFGLRTVRLHRAPDQFRYIINDREVFVRGSSYIPGLYLSQCGYDSLARDVGLAREANLNLLRVHVHVSPPELYDLCDRAGMLIWQDFELNWTHDDSPAFEARALKLQRAMIDLLGNHPSVVTWACHNEPTMILARRANLERHPDPALYADACAVDPTRPVLICSGQLEADWQRAGDAHTYYGALWSARYADVYRHRFRLNSEFGFEAPAALETLRPHPDAWKRLKHLDGQIEALWNYQAELIQFHIEHLRRLRAEGCAGYVHFWLADMVPQVGCGVLDANRLPKHGYAALKQASAPLHVALEHNGRRPRALWVFNDTMDSYPDALVSWCVYDEQNRLLLEGSAACAILANTSQRIAPADWWLRPEACQRVVLWLQDQTGAVLAENSYDHPFQPTLRPRGYPWKFDPYLGFKVFDHPAAPSLADQTKNPVGRLVPLRVREVVAEWVMRQSFPIWLASSIARLVDRLAM